MNKPWFNKPTKLDAGSHIAIIGGGISGVTLFLHLRKAGFKTTLIEKAPLLLPGASGNPVAILDPFLSISDTIEKSFYLTAYHYALKFYGELGSNIFQNCDLIKTAHSEEQMSRFKKLMSAYEDGFLTLSSEGLVCAPSGYVIPSKLRLMFEENKTILTRTSITNIKPLADKRWSLFDKNDQPILKADAVIISNSYLASEFEYANHFELDRVAGQISLLSPQYYGNEILCSEGYVTPTITTEWGDANICGATFDKDGGFDLTEAAHMENLSKSPVEFNKNSIIAGRRGIRAMTPDHLPLSGPAPNKMKYQKEYNGLHHGPRHKSFPEASYHHNLFINIGLGARGFLSAPILAKHLTALIIGKKSPLDEKMSNAIHPGRFIIRALSKR